MDGYKPSLSSNKICDGRTDRRTIVRSFNEVKFHLPIFVQLRHCFVWKIVISFQFFLENVMIYLLVDFILYFIVRTASYILPFLPLFSFPLSAHEIAPPLPPRPRKTSVLWSFFTAIRFLGFWQNVIYTCYA